MAILAEVVASVAMRTLVTPSAGITSPLHTCHRQSVSAEDHTVFHGPFPRLCLLDNGFQLRKFVLAGFELEGELL